MLRHIAFYLIGVPLLVAAGELLARVLAWIIR